MAIIYSRNEYEAPMAFVDGYLPANRALDTRARSFAEVGLKKENHMGPAGVRVYGFTSFCQTLNDLLHDDQSTSIDHILMFARESSEDSLASSS